MPIDATVATSGPSGAVVTVHAAADVCDSSRSNGRCSRGKSSSPPDATALHVLASDGGQVGLLVEEVGGAVAHAAGLEEQHEGVVADQVEEHVLALGEPRQPALHALEHLALRRAAPTARGPTARAR